MTDTKPVSRVSENLKFFDIMLKQWDKMQRIEEGLFVFYGKSPWISIRGFYLFTHLSIS
jgi:hypothetical protein